MVITEKNKIDFVKHYFAEYAAYAKANAKENGKNGDGFIKKPDGTVLVMLNWTLGYISLEQLEAACKNDFAGYKKQAVTALVTNIKQFKKFKTEAETYAAIIENPVKKTLAKERTPAARKLKDTRVLKDFVLEISDDFDRGTSTGEITGTVDLETMAVTVTNSGKVTLAEAEETLTQDALAWLSKATVTKTEKGPVYGSKYHYDYDGFTIRFTLSAKSPKSGKQ